MSWWGRNVNNLLDKLPELNLLDSSPTVLNYSCSQDDFEYICFQFQLHFNYIWLVDITTTVVENNQLEVKYIFLNFDDTFTFSVSFTVPESYKIKSIAHMWRNAMSFEQEIKQLFGIQFDKDYAKLYDIESSTPVMLKNNDLEVRLSRQSCLKDQYQYQFKPESALAHNQYEINVNTKKNLVRNCHVKTGSFHIGFEKMLEGCKLPQTYTTIESYFSSKALTWSFMLSHGIEKQKGITIPHRGQAVRMVLLELNRIHNHIQFILNLSFEMSLESLHTNSILWMKRIQSVLMSYTGNEYGANTIRIGGVRQDVSQVWLSRTLSEITVLEKSILMAYKNLLHKDQIKNGFDFPLVSKDMVGIWCVTGPLARSVGVNFDLRTFDPFYFYADIDFEIPIGVNGTAYDLLVIRVEEIFQSFKIIIQVLDNLPTGELICDEYNPKYRDHKPDQTNEDEYKKIVADFLSIGDINTFQMYEGSNGIQNLSFNFCDDRINRMKFSSQSFALKNLFEVMVRGRELDTVKSQWSILDINLKEVER